MTDRSKKLLRKISPGRRKRVLFTLERLMAGDEGGLDIKPIKGYKHIYRARVGNYRIIYRRENDVFTQIDIVKRDDRTYRDL